MLTKEDEVLPWIQKPGFDYSPMILIITKTIPDAKGTSSNQRLGRVNNAEYLHRRPYLETYADEAASEIAVKLQGYLDLIIGNYCNGNLVAYLLAYKMGLTQCTIMYAPKTKYRGSEIYWKKFYAKYHFSSQCTAGLIAMNNADFIITCMMFGGQYVIC